MVFAIPFLAIPIGGKSDPVNQGVAKPHLDINMKSILAMGGIMVMLFFVIPKIVHLYFPPSETSSQSGHHSRGTFTLILIELIFFFFKFASVKLLYIFFKFHRNKLEPIRHDIRTN